MRRRAATLFPGPSEFVIAVARQVTAAWRVHVPHALLAQNANVTSRLAAGDHRLTRGARAPLLWAKFPSLNRAVEDGAAPATPAPALPARGAWVGEAR